MFKFQITAKMLRIGLGLAATAFLVATIILAVQKAKLNADLKDAKDKLDYLESQLEGEVKPRSVRSLNLSIDYRLPKSLLPKHYNLYLHPNIDTGNFTGQVVLQLTVVEEATRQIILHAHKLYINHVYVSGPNGENLEVESYHLETLREFLIINMVADLETGTDIKLGIIFEGHMKDKIVGLYSSTYLTAEQDRRAIATSKFEPTYARQAFPCFDEPAMKATYDITLVRPTDGGYHALSNMNEENSQFLGQYTEVRFAKSVPMSTYLACFIVSDFAHDTKAVDTKGIGNNFDIRVFATAHQLNKVNFALDTAVTVTEFYIDYFQVEYPLPKLDMAAIPDFASNAMEHWGLVTYRETALLYDKSISSTWNKQRIAAVVAHELAHMWFGNLVTMMWWNDLWLNEGFARYMEYKGVNEVYPSWGMPDQFLVHALHPVMKYDSSVSSHPIVQTVANPDQITEIFDTISYEKGASVIRMLEDVVGAEKFAQAVTNYLNAFKYQNAETNDFITEVEKLGLDFDVKLFMRTWTTQMGLPVVEVRRTSAATFTLTQKRFFANIDDYDIIYDDSEFNYTWNIPLTYNTDVNSEIQRIWFAHDVPKLTVTVPATTKWLKLNVAQVGYYRVNYEESIWKEIIAHLVAQPQSFGISDRAHLLNDVFAMADASQLSYEIALDTTIYLEKELDFVPWFVAVTKLQALQVNLRYTDTYVSYLKYARNLIAKVYDEVTWSVNADNHLINRLRVSILSAACAFGVPDCLTEAANKFNTWLADPKTKPDPDLREIVYYYGMQHVGKQQTWEQVWDIFVAEEDASEKTKLMYGLSAVRVPWLLYRFIELAGNEKFVRRHEYFACLQNIASNAVGESIVWEYVRENWTSLVDRFGLNDRTMGRMIPLITESFASETKLEEMMEFFAKYSEAGAGTAARKQALETVKYNIKWLEDNKDKVASWLSKQNF